MDGKTFDEIMTGITSGLTGDEDVADTARALMKAVEEE